jgi:catechol 2,3-dioxygenase-like lactoylglutathione lyase family enzyme
MKRIEEVAPMIDHIGIPVTDLAASRELYAVALAPLGYKVLYENEEYGIVGFGAQAPQLWLQPGAAAAAVHVAIVAKDRAAVGSFYEAALSAGAKDNGPPGTRERYAPGYYAAYVHDLDGNNLEAVVHEQ